MATFDATLGSSTATSYVSVAAADAYYAGGLHETAWAALTTAQKEAALMAATAELEALTFSGKRCSPSSDAPAVEQALQWPRSDVTCKGIAAACTMLPKEVERAVCYLALELHTTPPTVGSSATAAVGAVQSQSLGELSISYYAPTESGQPKVASSAPLILQRYPALVDILGCWAAGAGSGRIIARVRS